MRAGLLARARITISRAAKTQNGFGEDLVEWQAIGSYWANIRALQGRELESARQTFSEARFRIDMRHQGSTVFQREDRITWGSRTLDVLDAEDPDQKQRRLFITAKEFVS